jgi:cytidine deaminase
MTTARVKLDTHKVITNQELIDEAQRVLRPYQTQDGRLHADVGAALLSRNGKIYTGVCVDTPSWGLCAERSAIAAMITDGEYRIEKIVAVWTDEKTNTLYVVPPCGICREFMRQIDQQNLETEVVLGANNPKRLKELLPFHEWPDR